MRKLKSIFGVVILALFVLTSCSQNPTEIKLSNLHTACDYVDAIEKCLDAIIETRDDIARGNIGEEKKGYVKQLKKKMKEIERAYGKKFGSSKKKECENFSRVKLKYKSL